MSELPIACNLTSAELQERRGTVLQEFHDAVIKVTELEHGYAYALPAEWLEQLATMIDLERQCCPFLQFCLSVPPNGGMLQLELTGPEGTKEFLTNTFNPGLKSL